MRSDIKRGGRFPDYELPDHESKLRKLSELQRDDPMVLTLARGHYCPKEHQQHLELAVFYPRSLLLIRRSLPLQRTTITRSRGSERRSARSGLFSPTPIASCRRILILRSTGTSNTM